MTALVLACPCPGCAVRSVRYVYADDHGTLLQSRYFRCVNCKRVWSPEEFQQALAATAATTDSPKVCARRVTEREVGTAAPVVGLPGCQRPGSPTAPDGEAA